MRGTVKGIAALLAATIALAACEGGETYIPTKRKGDTAPRMEKDIMGSRETIWGGKGLLFGGGDDNDGSGGGIGVNSFLWRASLDTLSFLPLASADPFGGVIITDWYTPPENPRERVKATVYILSRALRSDGVRVAVFRQVKDDEGAWVEAPVADGLGRRLEDSILTRARQLRTASLDGQ